jgi:hypothetical protein
VAASLGVAGMHTAKKKPKKNTSFLSIFTP